MAGTETKQKAQKAVANQKNDPSTIDLLIRMANDGMMKFNEKNGKMDKILAFLAEDDWKNIDYKEGVCLNMSYFWKDWKSAKILLDKGANTNFIERRHYSADYHWARHPVYASIYDGAGGNVEGLRMILERGETINSIPLTYAFDILFGQRYGYFRVDAVAKVAVEFALKMAKDDIENSRIENSRIASYKNNPIMASFKTFARLIENDSELSAILIKGRNDVLNLYGAVEDGFWDEDTIVTAFQKKDLDIAKLLLYHGADIRYERRATLNGKDSSAVYALAIGNGPQYQHLLTAYQTFHTRYPPHTSTNSMDDVHHHEWLKSARELLSTGTDILQWLPLDKIVQWHSRFALYHPDSFKIDETGKLSTVVAADDDDEELKFQFINLSQMVSMQPTGFHVLLQLHLGGLDLSGQVGWTEILEPRLVEYIARVYGSLHPALLPPLIALSFSYF